MKTATILTALLLAACGGAEGDDEPVTLADYVPSTSAHLTCVDAPGKPCCPNPPDDPVECPEGTHWTLDVDDGYVEAWGCVDENRHYNGAFINIKGGSVSGYGIIDRSGPEPMGFNVQCYPESGVIRFEWVDGCVRRCSGEECAVRADDRC